MRRTDIALKWDADKPRRMEEAERRRIAQNERRAAIYWERLRFKTPWKKIGAKHGIGAMRTRQLFFCYQRERRRLADKRDRQVMCAAGYSDLIAPIFLFEEPDLFHND